VSPFFRVVLRCFARTLPGNANDKSRSRGRAGHGQASPLSTRVDKDRRTQSGPAVPLPKFPPLRANSVERDIGPYVTQEANESSRHASAHLPSRSPSGREQSERARRAARACRYSGSFREDNVSPRRLGANKIGSDRKFSLQFCHSERSRGISEFFSFARAFKIRDASTPLSMTREGDNTVIKNAIPARLGTSPHPWLPHNQNRRRLLPACKHDLQRRPPRIRRDTCSPRDFS
jgi:hypothetical protein